MVIGEFNLAGIVVGTMFGVVICGSAFLAKEYHNFKEEVRKSMEWWVR